MQVFDLQSKISLDSSDFFSGLRKSERGMKDFGDKMAMGFDKLKSAAKWLVTGVAFKKGVDAVKSLATETAHAGDRIDKQSQALGVSRKAFQEWDYILSQSGASIDSLGFSMRTLSSAILDGSNETDEALKTIGLSVDSLKGLTQEQAFERVVRAFQTLPAGMQKSAAAIKLFGRNGQTLLPLLNSDIYTIDILRAQAQDLGLVMSDEGVDAAVAYGDALDTLQRTFTGLRYSIGSKILPVLTNAFTKITNYAGKIRRAYEAEGLSGVFKTLVADIRNIKWPTWDDVKKTAISAWDDIKRGALTLGGLVFGKKEDGSVAWPGWTEVVDAAIDAWDGIKDGALTLVGLVLGKKADGSVNWPTWANVRQAANDTWKAIKQNALDLGGIVFGRREDGKVNWPTWKDVKAIGTDIWNSIKERALNIGAIVFGRKEDGRVNWPTWKDVRAAGIEIWNTIKEKALDLGGIIFGRKENGKVNWPTWKDVKDAGIAIWNVIKDKVAWFGGLIFGKNTKGKVNWPTLKDLTDAADDLWKEVVGYVGKLGGLIFGDSPEAVTVFQEIAKAIGAISAAVLAYGFYTKLSQTVSLLRSFFTLDISGFSKTGLILAGIAAGMMLIYEHWTDIEPAMRSIGEWITDNVITPITNAIAAIEDLLYEVGLIKKEVDIKESIGVVDKETTPVRIPVAWGDKISPILAKYFGWGEVDKFGESLTNAIETGDFTSFVDQVIKEMITADKTSQQTIDAVEELKKACSEVAGEYPITFPVNYPLTIQQYVQEKRNGQLSSHSGSGGSFENGLWDVPYNDFPALLHEGEMVLTKTQANEYRDGGGSGASSRMIVSAIQKLENTMANLRLMVGEKEFGRATTEYGGHRMNNYIGGVDNRLAAGYGS